MDPVATVVVTLAVQEAVIARVVEITLDGTVWVCVTLVAQETSKVAVLDDPDRVSFI